MINIDELIHELSEACDDWARTNGAANLLEGMLKTHLARLVNKAEGTSFAARENNARASEAYAQAVTEMCKAREEADQARGRLECVRTKIDLIRTESANARAAR